MGKIEDRLIQLLKHCGSEGWDGDDAVPVTQETAEATHQMLSVLFNSEPFMDMENVTLTASGDGSIEVTVDQGEHILEFIVWKGSR
jgi:hypothetical protein